MPLQDMFLEDYYRSPVDNFGIPWMFNSLAK